MADTINDQIKIKKPLVGTQSPDTTTGKGTNTKLANPNSSYFNTDVSQLRASGNELAAIRQLARVHGDVSATVSAMVRIANSGIAYRVYDINHQLSPEGSTLLRSILKRLELQTDYTTGFDNRQSVAGVIETLIRSTLLTGAVALELVLDKSRLPYALKPVSVEKVVFVVSQQADGVTQKLFPRIVSSKGNIDLDIPTFLYAALDFDPNSAYTFSPLEPSINTSIFHSEVVQDIRRVVNRSGHSRLVIKLDYEALTKNAPMNVRGDSDKLTAWVEAQRTNVVTEIEKLAPESAIVTFSNIEADYLNSQIGAASDYTGLVQIIDSILATSLKTPSSILGKASGGSQNTSSVESLLFLKSAAGLHTPVQTVLNRAFTLALRLLGFEGYVEAEFKPISIRPEEELEAFKTMKQQRVLEQLSYGFITDEEAAEILGTGELSPEFEPLSGTGFLTQKADAASTNPDANPGTRALTTDSPKNAGGKSNSNKT